MKAVTIHLQPLDQSNWEKCANIKVSPNQEDALPSNLYSIAQLNFYPKTQAVAIVTSEDEVVGFATFGIPEGEGAPKIFRLMIDENHQGKGYGTAALKQIVTKMFANSKSDEIQVCYNPHKQELTDFYAAVGFEEKELVPCTRRPEGKMLAVLKQKNFVGISQS
jgi:diamine N-acetyltransferase